MSLGGNTVFLHPLSFLLALRLLLRLLPLRLRRSSFLPFPAAFALSFHLFLLAFADLLVSLYHAFGNPGAVLRHFFLRWRISGGRGGVLCRGIGDRPASGGPFLERQLRFQRRDLLLAGGEFPLALLARPLVSWTSPL